MKRTFWTGVVLAGLGAVLFLILVVPLVGNDATMRALPNGQSADGLKVWSVMTAALGMAIRSALIGVGVGRWTHPTPSPTDGHPEV